MQMVRDHILGCKDPECLENFCTFCTNTVLITGLNAEGYTSPEINTPLVSNSD